MLCGPTDAKRLTIPRQVSRPPLLKYCNRQADTEELPMRSRFRTTTRILLVGVSQNLETGAPGLAAVATALLLPGCTTVPLVKQRCDGVSARSAGVGTPV